MCLVVAPRTNMKSHWSCLNTPSCWSSYPPTHPSTPRPPLLAVLSGAINEKDWTDTIGERRAWRRALPPACVGGRNLHSGFTSNYLIASLFSVLLVLLVSRLTMFLSTVMKPDHSRWRVIHCRVVLWNSQVVGFFPALYDDHIDFPLHSTQNW